MKRVLQKLLTLFIWMRHPTMKSQYRWFLRYYYLGKIEQIKFFIKDVIFKKPYKTIDYSGEFQQELLYVIPHAYWHYKNGTLEKTIASKGTKEFYYFSKNHDEAYVVRDWKSNFNTNFPHGPHNHKLNTSKWLQVPYKEVYKNEQFTYNKPILIVANRFNSEWGNSPVSYLDIPTLNDIFNMLKADFQIIYNRPPASKITNDNSEVLELGDYNWIKENHPEVIQVTDLFDLHKEKVNSYNHLQLLIYANCENFISVHGGTATLASNFGGKNIIFSKMGHEHYLKEFTNIFPLLSGAKIWLTKEYDELKNKIRNVYIK